MQIDDKKAFLDSVHGYIYVNSTYCKKIIDTPIFQRLRRIEQVSFRCLCPSARHDRFIHSLGVYYIGSKMLKDIESSLVNTGVCIHIEEFFSKRDFSGWQFIKATFEIACLLHDCGHAPFSHIFESYYVEDKTVLIDDIMREIKAYASTRSYDEQELINIDQIQLELEARAAKINYHELCSAWLVLHNKGFREVIVQEKADPVLIARMITGCIHLKQSDFKGDGPEVVSKFNKELNIREQLENCFISLLNGHIIDADRLDYFARDRWATGLNTSSVDLDRLLYSITIMNKASKDNPEYVVCVNKRAISELNNIAKVKDFLKYNIINHHKVVYDTRILIKAVKRLALVMNGHAGSESEEQREIDRRESRSMYKLFNYKSFLEEQTFSFTYDGKDYIERLKLTTDDDIVFLLKKYQCLGDSNNYADEWLYRQHRRIPLWKSYVEFADNFRSLGDDVNLNKLQECTKLVCRELIAGHTNKRGISMITDKIEISDRIVNSPCLIDNGNEPLYIKIKSDIRRYKDVASQLLPYNQVQEADRDMSSMWGFFYLYVPRLFDQNSEASEKAYKSIYGKLCSKIIDRYKDPAPIGG